VLVGPSTYRLSGFLRGQSGTEALAALAHPAGTRFVLVDGALSRLSLDAGVLGAPATLRIGPADVDLADPAMLETTVTPAGVGLMPLAPVRLTARRQPSGDVAIAFIRRTRVGGDRFDAPEVPLGEAVEAYAVAILADGAAVRTWTVPTPAATYAAADQIADFGTLPATLDIAVRQLSQAVGPGREARATVLLAPA
jgi:hypothetical protein